jgi:hypothetical protein
MSEPQSPPNLSVVEAPADTEPAEPRRGMRRVLPWLLLVAALVFAWLWLNQLERTQSLERRVSTLELDLAGARDDLAASEAHMDEVRGGIEQVGRELDALRALAADPDGAESDAVAPEAETLPAEALPAE